MLRRPASPSRWTWVLPVLATAFVVACDTSLSGINTQQTWGFVTVAATRSQGGAHFANVEGIFFKGSLSAVPNAGFTADTCADGVLTTGNNLQGVTYLDAGTSLTATIGGIPTTFDRTPTTDGLAYYPAGSVAYNPGDSIVVTIPGATGGFPTGAVRAKTAEAFTISNIDVPGGTDAIPLTWSTPQDANSAIIISLRYETTQNPGTLTRNVLCTFVDDGVDSIPFRWHTPWSSASGNKEVVVTRLRTNYVAAADANLGVISTYQVPTPPQN